MSKRSVIWKTFGNDGAAANDDTAQCKLCMKKSSIPVSVRRRSRRTFSTNFEIFRRRVDSVVIYFFTSSIPTSNFSTTRRNFQSVLSVLFSLKTSC